MADISLSELEIHQRAIDAVVERGYWTEGDIPLVVSINQDEDGDWLVRIDPGESWSNYVIVCVSSDGKVYEGETVVS